VEGFASYEGRSGFLRWWPKLLLGGGFWVLVTQWTSAIQWTTFLLLAAWVQGHFFPWRFSVYDDGLDLVFPFGRRVFLPKRTTTVRLETVGAVARIDGHHRPGYLLQDGVLYEPDQRARLRAALNFYGYNVA
jgi:hypothetical protein